MGEFARLTTRDRELLALLARHHVLTADQIHRLLFDHPTTARHRLALLTRRAVLARFRHHRPQGTHPWHYTVGVIGAALWAAATDAPPPPPSRTRARVLALAGSPRLKHLVAVNDVFVGLARHARTHPGRHLDQWADERAATAMCGRIVRPDGYGQWTELPGPAGGGNDHRNAGTGGGDGGGVTVGFFLELDRGTEPLPRVTAKLDGYRHLADAGLAHPVLFVLPAGTRERHLHAHPGLHRAAGLVVATTTAGRLHGPDASAADPVWWHPGTPNRVRLADLTRSAIAPGAVGGWS